MLWTVKYAAQFLSLEPYQVYYLLFMGEIEACKIGNAWRLAPEAVKDYDKRFPDRKNRKASGNFIYTGDCGFLFRTLQNCLPPDSLRKAACLERRRGQLVHRAKRHQNISLEKLKPLTQLELFAS